MLLVSTMGCVIVDADEAPPRLDNDPDSDFCCRSDDLKELGLSVYLM